MCVGGLSDQTSRTEFVQEHVDVLYCVAGSTSNSVASWFAASSDVPPASRVRSTSAAVGLSIQYSPLRSSSSTVP